MCIYVSGTISIYKERSATPTSNAHSNNDSANRKPITLETKGIPLGNITLEDLGFGDNDEQSDIPSLKTLYEAEDDYWEIERFGGNYYKVRREDYDRDYYGKDEFDCEELIGNTDALYRSIEEQESDDTSNRMP